MTLKGKVFVSTEPSVVMPIDDFVLFCKPSIYLTPEIRRDCLNYHTQNTTTLSKFNCQSESSNNQSILTQQ